MCAQLVGEHADATAVNQNAPAPASVLFVDDEMHILSCLRRLFHDQDQLTCHFASSPLEALAILAHNRIDVIVSDHRMPVMSGAEFLARVRERRPHAIRLMLTGQADLAAVQKAVNDGEIYRFLLKPWSDDELVQAVMQAVQFGRLSAENARLQEVTQQQNAALEQANTRLEEQVQVRTSQLADALLTARTLNRELEETIYSGTKVLFSLVQLARPELGSHCRRVAEHAVAVGTKLGFSAASLRELEIAALLHDGGKLHLPLFLAEKDVADFSREEAELYRSHPFLGSDYLKGTAFYGRVAKLILYHHERYDGSGFPNRSHGASVPIGAYVIGLVDLYDHLITRPGRNQEYVYQHTVQILADSADHSFPSAVVQAALDYLATFAERAAADDVAKIGTAELVSGSRLARDLYTMSGSLLAPAGTTLTAQNVARIRAIARVDQIAGDIWIVQNARRQES